MSKEADEFLPQLTYFFSNENKVNEKITVNKEKT